MRVIRSDGRRRRARRPTRSPRSSHHSLSLASIRIEARGSTKLAVPTCTALAPARISSTASQPLATPPTPMIGRSGRAAWTSKTVAHRDRMDRPAAVPAAAGAERRAPRRRVDHHAEQGVDQRHRLGAGRCTAAATSTTRSVLALSLAQRGRPHAAVAAITSADSSGSWAKIAAPSLQVGARQVDLDGDDVRAARRPAVRRQRR